MLTFTRTTQVHDPEIGSVTPTTSTITGEGIVVKGDVQRYKSLGLVESVAPCVLFTPASYPLKAFTDEFVQPGDTVDLLGTTYTVRDVQPTCPDGYVIVARIIVSR
ncbi:MAG: hypothetical protein IPK12_23470 [Gemmatimonadetes bacterium]|nr:hypothetical protein [Gemmatimonadota bacterium]